MDNEKLREQGLRAKHLNQAQINLVPESNWYKYKLQCGHDVYSRVRINVPRTFNEHFVRCPKCQKAGVSVLNWQAVEGMEAVTNEHVSDVLDGDAFVLPKRFLRTDGHSSDGKTIASGNPFPYTNKSAEY